MSTLSKCGEPDEWDLTNAKLFNDLHSANIKIWTGKTYRKYFTVYIYIQLYFNYANKDFYEYICTVFIRMHFMNYKH